jgi:two-component sensor histidine kinase/GAF domain-containing protein
MAETENTMDSELRERLGFESFLSELSARFVKLDPDEVDREIGRALRRLAEFLGADQCGLLETDPEKEQAYITRHWYPEGMERVVGGLNMQAIFPWSFEKLVIKGDSLRVPDTSALPPEAETDRASWSVMGVKSSLVVPLCTGKSIPFALALNTVHRKFFWPDEYIPRLRLTGEILMGALARKHAEEELAKTTHLLNQIREAQSSYIVTGDPQVTFGGLLDALVSMTNSEFGFVDEVLQDDDGSLYKLSLALSNISWNTESARLYEELKERRLEFRNMNNLAGIPALAGEVVIANDVPNDERSAGVPPGHPPLRTFMGLPIYFGKQLVGVAGVANRAEGYDEKTARFLEPFLSSCANLIHASRHHAKAREVVDSLRENEANLREAQSIARMGRWELELASKRFMWSEGIFNLFEDGRQTFAETYEEYLAFIHSDDRESVERAYRESIANGTTFEMEHRLLLQDGGIKWVSVIGHTEYDIEGNAVRSIGTVQDITHRKQAEADLKASLAEKDVLLREVHHRVKNNLASIIALLDLQKEGISDKVALASLQDLSTRIMSMALVHTRLYRSENLDRIDLREYLDELTSHLLVSYRARTGVKCFVDANGVEMGIDTAIPTGLIINELVTNAMKHAFPTGKPRYGSEQCEILISVRKDGDICTLTVADNGVGLPRDFDWRTCASLGFSLVIMLGESQLGGKLTLDRSRGTCLTLRFRDRRKTHQGG